MRKIIFSLGLVLLAVLFSPAIGRAGEKQPTDEKSSVQPTPTWTTTQQKKYEIRMRMYHKPFFMKPSRVVYVCAFCGYKGDQPGNCPKCGFPLTQAGSMVTAKVRKGFAYHCDKCGAQSNKPGDCPRHCGGKMVRN